MEISNAKYTKLLDAEANSSIRVTINDIVMNVPLDPDNRHYQAILEWVAEDNTITPAS